jgi:enoyl-CoA hydratase/carnithine racemase
MSDSIRISSPAAGVALLELNRPDRLNALDTQMVTEDLRASFEAINADPAARVMVLTGVGRAFCAGGDLDSESFTVSGDVEAFIRKAQQTIVALHRMGIPTIAAVNGAAAGGGLGLALACDMRVASKDALFVAPFLGMALVPDLGVSYFLPRVVGTAAALDLTLSGRKIRGQEALDLGLVSRLVDDARSAALDLASSIAAAPPEAVAATKAAIYGSSENEMERHLLEVEPALQTKMMASDEFRSRFDKYRQAVGG